jgi:hypothetical protein
MRIRTALLSGLTAGVLLASGGAFAQSHQGGYLGVNPGAQVIPHATVAAPTQGSGQGGYLGLNAGARLTSSGAPLVEQGSGQGGYLGQQPWVDPEQPR